MVKDSILYSPPYKKVDEMKVLVSYYSRTGHAEAMAKAVVQGIKEEGILPLLKKIEETGIDDLLEADCIIIGCPTYYGSMPWEVKKLIDESIKHHGKLNGKVGGAFSTSHNVGGGNETTILSILKAMLIHGMVIQGYSDFDHYGPVAIEKPAEEDLEKCRIMGKRITELGEKLFG